jgi:hypothetical protein
MKQRAYSGTPKPLEEMLRAGIVLFHLKQNIDHRLYPEGLPEKALAVQISPVGNKSALPVV